MRYQFGGVVRIKMNLILWNPYAVRAARVIYNLPRDMLAEDVRITANWDSLFDTYEVKIATLIYNIYNRITPSCLEHIIQRKESKYDLRHQHRVSVQRFETYYMKNSISYRGSIVWNLLEPSAVSARDYMTGLGYKKNSDQEVF